MNGLFLKDIILDGKNTNIRIRDGKFQSFGAELTPADGEQVLDGRGSLAVLPAFYNGHTHAAMSLMRGYADDLELFTWLNDHIWPFEAKLTREDVYNGTRLAILEMIRSGTVFFNDQYFLQKEAVRAVEEMGVRACIGMLALTLPDGSMPANVDNRWLLDNRKEFSGRIQLSYSPHAIYTVSEKKLREFAELAAAENGIIHTHLAETQKEFDDCLGQHNMTPVTYLDSLGLLTEKTVLAHSVYLNDHDMEIIHERKSVLVHNPVSNMKLCSGRFRAETALAAGCRCALGTDGACSNNSLSMMDEMKSAALLAKLGSGNPKLFDAKTVFGMATANGADAFGIHAGVIAEGYLADCILVNRNAVTLVPGTNLISDMVYAADSSCIDSVVCNGKVLMEHGRIEGEEEIIAKARESMRNLLAKV